MVEQQDRRRVTDRRQGKDLVLRLVSVCGALGGFLALLTIVVLAKAKPHAFAPFDKEAFSVRAYWDPAYAQWLFYLMLAGFVIGLAGLVFNARRLKRRGDSLRVNLVLLAAASLCGMIIYLFSFGAP